MIAVSRSTHCWSPQLSITPILASRSTNATACTPSAESSQVSGVISPVGFTLPMVSWIVLTTGSMPPGGERHTR